MNRQKEPDVSVDDAILALINKYPGTRYYADYFDYFAWPETFPNTGGPFAQEGYLYGQAMTRFTIEAWVCGKDAVLFCNGKIIEVTNDWKGVNIC